MLSYEKEKEIQQAVKEFALAKTGNDSRLAYAYLFGMLWGSLTEKQIKSLEKIVKEG